MTSPGKHGKTNQSPTPQTHWWNWGAVGGRQWAGLLQTLCRERQAVSPPEWARSGSLWVDGGREFFLVHIPGYHPWVLDGDALAGQRPWVKHLYVLGSGPISHSPTPP